MQNTDNCCIKIWREFKHVLFSSYIVYLLNLQRVGRFGFMVLNATFNNISAISSRIGCLEKLLSIKVDKRITSSFRTKSQKLCNTLFSNMFNNVRWNFASVNHKRHTHMYFSYIKKIKYMERNCRLINLNDIFFKIKICHLVNK